MKQQLKRTVSYIRLPAARLLAVVALLLASPALDGFQQSAAAQTSKGWTGGAAFYSLPPEFVCAGDSFQFQAGASVSPPPSEPTKDGLPPPSPLPVVNVKISAELGQVTPDRIIQPGEDIDFTFTYTAKKAGRETVTLLVNDGLATQVESFDVHEKCAYDAYLVGTLHLVINDEERYETLTNLTGTGIMKRVSEDSQFLQGDGKFHVEETMLNKPPACVQWYMPPFTLSAPFELDGKVSDEGHSLDVILSFLSPGAPTYHGNAYCVDEHGTSGVFQSFEMGSMMGADGKITAAYPIDGGIRQVEIKGMGMDYIYSMAEVDYTATLAIIPR